MANSEERDGRTLYGIILSLTAEMIHDILHGRNIYARPAAEVSKDLQADQRVYFYGSDDPGKLQGEARISMVRYLPLGQVLQYRDKLFLPPEQFARYVAEQSLGEEDIMLVLGLAEPTKYMKPVNCPFAVPPEGKFVTKELYEEILGANK